MSGRQVETVLANAEEILSMAEAGYRDAIGRDPRRRRAGLLNLFTYGRSVTLVLQTLSNTVDGFDDWWEPFRKRWSQDPLMRFATKARNAILKEGSLPTYASTAIGFNRTVDMRALVAAITEHAPPNTVSTFIGDQLGGNGWIVRLPDGSEATIYFDLPADVDVDTRLTMPDLPAEHDGMPIAPTIEAVGAAYLATLRKIVDDTRQRFAL